MFGETKYSTKETLDEALQYREYALGDSVSVPQYVRGSSQPLLVYIGAGIADARCLYLVSPSSETFQNAALLLWLAATTLLCL